MTKFKIRPHPSRGFTLIELMLSVAIIGILGSLFVPRVQVILQRAYQSTARSDIGNLRSALALYYSDTGRWPMEGIPDGYGDLYGVSLSQMLVPKYMPTMKPPRLEDELFTFNGLSESYDQQAAAWFSFNPPDDVAILRGAPGPVPFVNRPYIYDPDAGVLYYGNGNYDSSGLNRFYDW